MSSTDEGFSQQFRLRRSADFQRVQRSGRRWAGRFLVVLHQPNGLTGPRVGLVVSRKVGNAVVRNRVKRWLREASRRQIRSLTGVDVVLIARSGAGSAGLAELAHEVDRALQVVRQEYA